MDIDNKKINNWVDIVKIAMEQSTSLFILAFSWILVISSIITDAETKYVLASFFTLFYAMANHFLAVFSKTESIRPYARGKNTFWLYVVISFLLFIIWIVIMTNLLLFCNLLFNSCFFWWLVGIWILLYVAWLIMIYKSKNEAETQSGELQKNEKIYSVKSYCGNCDYNRDLSKEIYIPKRKPFTDYPCPMCKILALKKEEK